MLYVIQLERQRGECLSLAAMQGRWSPKARSQFGFSPERGLTEAFLGRASYTIDINRSLAFESAVRQNGDGYLVKGEYSQAIGQHWRATAGATWIGGQARDFLGQFNRNSYALLAIRYSF
jgi:hypothetical protein